MLKIFVFLSLLFFMAYCKKSEDNTKQRNLLGLLTLNRIQSLGKGSQSIAEYFGDSSSLIAEDSVESGSSGSTGGVRSYSSTVESGAGTVTITNEDLNCKFGGSVTFNGAQSFTVNSRTSPQVFTLTLNNGFRKIQYNNCRVSRGLTINSGELEIQQTSPATTLISETQISSSGVTVRRTLNNLSSTVKGSLNVTVSGARGNGTATVEIDQVLVLTQRVREWNFLINRLRNPSLKSRQGSLTGTVTINGTTYTIDKSLDVNVEDSD